MEIGKLAKGLEKILSASRNYGNPLDFLDRVSRKLMEGDFGKELKVIGYRVWGFNGKKYMLFGQYGYPIIKDTITIHPEGEDYMNTMMETGVFVGKETNVDLMASGVRYFASLKFDGGKQLLSFSLLDSNVSEEKLTNLFRIIRMQLRPEFENSQMKTQLSKMSVMQSRLNSGPRINFNGYDVYGVSSSVEQVGGDLFHSKRLGKNLNLCVADAMGHGVGALASIIKFHTALEMAYGDGRHNLFTKDLLQKINRMFHGDSFGGVNGWNSFVTLSNITLTPSGNMFYFNLGHEPPFVLRNNEVIRLEGATPPLGVMSDVMLERRFGKLEQGDILVMYSDGITETVNSKGNMLKTEGLVEIVRKNRGFNSEGIVKKTFEELRIFSTLPKTKRYLNNPDDKTLVVVKKI